MDSYSTHPWRRGQGAEEETAGLHPWRRLTAQPKPEIPDLPPMPKAPKGFEERFPIGSQALDLFAPTGLRAAAVGEHVAEAVKDIPRVITELRQEKFTGADPYAETLQRVNRSLQRGGRQARNLATILFSPFSLLLSPAEGVVTPIVGTVTNLLKGVSTLDPGELKIAPEMTGKSFLKVLSTPGAVRTENENLNAILDEAGGILPFVLAGGVISRARVHPWRPTPAELRAPAHPAEVEAPAVVPRPPVKPSVIYTPERLQQMAAEDAAVRAPIAPPRAEAPQAISLPPLPELPVARPAMAEATAPRPAISVPPEAPRVTAAEAAKAKEPWEMTRDERRKEGWIEVWRQDRADAPTENLREGSHWGTLEQAKSIAEREGEAGRPLGKLRHAYIQVKNPLDTYDGGFWEKPIREAADTGHDAVRYLNEGEKVGGYSYIPLSKEQIKPVPPAEELVRVGAAKPLALALPPIPRTDLLPPGWKVEVGKTRAKEGHTYEAEVDWRGKRIVFATSEYMGNRKMLNHEIAHVGIEILPEKTLNVLLDDYAKLKAPEWSAKGYEPEWVRKNHFDREEIAMDYGNYLENPASVAPELATLFERSLSKEVSPAAAKKDLQRLEAPALGLSPVPGKAPPVAEGELSANPVFNPRFWQKADALIRPLTFKVEHSIEQVFGKLPFSVRRWFQEDPQLKRIMHEARTEVGVQRSETDAVLRMVLKQKPSAEELVIADRIARGVPADLSAAKAPLQESVGEAAEYAHRVAQEITTERAAMGLPVRSDWLEGPKHWYPNFWQQHLFSPRMIAGRLFGFFRKGGASVRPSAAEMGSLKARTTDRWVVVNSSGDVAKAGEGREAIFSKAEDAQAFLRANSGYKVRFFDVAERGLKETTFPSIGERTAWLESAGDSIHVREMLPGKHLRIVEPMTHEQMVAHGLIEDLTLNLRYGFGKERALLAKTRALQKLGQQLAIDAPQPGYVKLSETGFDIPAKLAERNPWIARLRDGYVPELVADGLNALYGRRGAWSNYFRAVEGTLRKWVTVYSPFRHPRNLIENYIPLAFRDAKAALDLPAMRAGFQDFVRAARGEKDVPYWQEFEGSGLATTDILRGEFETVWKTIDTVKPGNMELSVAERMGIWAETNPVARRLLKTRDFVQQMYRAEDQIWKYYYFRTLRERAWTPEAAAQRARRTFFDYEDVPPYVRAVNRVVPFVPNITFQYARIILSALRDDPASTPMKLGLLMYGYAFMREKAMEAAGITDQDEANMDRVGIKWHEFPLPMTDDKGRNLIVNLQWLIPFSEIELLRYSAAEEEPARGLAQAVRRFIPMVGQPVATAISQRGAFGQPILTGAEPRGEARKKLAREVAISALPGLLGQYQDRLYKNAAAGPEAKEPWGQRLAEGLVGNIQRIRSGERIGLRKALIAGEAREVQEEAGRQRGRLIRGRISGETFREEIGKLRKRSSEEAAAHPGTLAVVKALEEGRRGEAREEYQKLKDSEFYANSEEALQAIRDQLNRRGRLAELEKAPVVPARETVAAIVDEFRRTGRVNQGGRRMLKTRLTALSESDQKAVLDYLEQQVGIARQERTRRVIPPVAGLPSTGLPPIPK